MNNQVIIDYLKNYDLTVYKHASNIITKHNNWNTLSDKQKAALPIIIEEYFKFLSENEKLKGFTEEIIVTRTILLNSYYDFIKSNNYDNVFTSQGKFRPTILEEFMYVLFKDLISEIKSKINNGDNNLNLGSIKAYTNLYFSGLNFESFVKSPQIGIHQKDQDFAIYKPVEIVSGNNKIVKTNLPIVSIENKTYIDKTMLDGSISTAEKIKSGNPYSLYIIIAERYAVGLEVDPVYSKIDQIYILRKDNKKDTMEPIYSDVLIDLVSFVKSHLERNWSDVGSKLKNLGKII